MPIVLAITDAGEAAVQAASGSDPVIITQIGLSNTPFTMAPTLIALPGEFKRVPAVAGLAASPNQTHMAALDTSSDAYNVTGFGIFLSDGTLFAAYSGAEVQLSKASLAFALLALDIKWEGDLAASIEFGAAVFTSPPATEGMRGIVELLTQAEADAALDNERALTALRAKAALPTWLLASTVLAKLITVDGAGSGIDADMLDGQHANQLVPTGEVKTFAMAAAPAGFLACDGAAVSRTTYAALFAALGTLYGPGDGATTFNLPDARDRVVLGGGGLFAVGASGGTATHDHGGATAGHALTEAQLPAHGHQVFAAATSGANIAAGQTAAWSSGSSSGNQDYDIKGSATGATLGATSSVGGSSAHAHGVAEADHRPPFLAMLVCIKT